MTRENRALELRLEGHSYRTISAIMQQEAADGKLNLPENYSFSACHVDIQRCINELQVKTAHNVQELRSVELQRLDYYLTKLSAGVNGGDPVSINSALKIVETRAKLLGLFAPIAVQVNELASKQIEAEFNLFFEMIEEDDQLPTWVKQRVLDIANNVQNCEATAEAN
jgi:hypothetical protein